MASIDEVLKSKFTDDKHRFAVNLVYTANWFKNLYSDFLNTFGISSPQFNILRILRGAKDWLAMTTVKERMVEKSPNVTRLADKLIEKKLIERKRSETDRRVVFVKITDAGLNLLKRIDDAEFNGHSEFFNAITPEEAKQVSELFDRMRG